MTAPRMRGFTLVELAIVLVIVGTLTRSLIVPFGEFVEERRVIATRARLEQVRAALIGHLVSQGALPCPLSASLVSAGTMTAPSGASGTAGEAPDCGRGSGLLPASIIGMPGPIAVNGALLDAWGRPLQYVVSLADSRAAGNPQQADWTTVGELSAVGLTHLQADLVLCRLASADRCPRGALRTDTIAFVVLSTGADPTDRDVQIENLDGDTTFAIAPRSDIDGYRFDDQLVWASRNELAYWLLRAEWLP